MKGDRILEIRHLSKTFGTNPVLKDIDFSVSSGDVTCIIGASGSGKSTLLRCLNLLETPTTGEIMYHGTNIADKKVNEMCIRDRPITGMMGRESVPGPLCKMYVPVPDSSDIFYLQIAGYESTLLG